MHFYQFTPSPEEEDLLTQFKMQCYLHTTIHPYVFKGNETLLQLFKNDFINGITLTAPGFYAPQGRKITLAVTQEQFYDDIVKFSHGYYRITNFEMETAALYGFSKLMGHRCVSLNVLLANRATGTFSNNPSKAVDVLIQKALAVIKQL